MNKQMLIFVIKKKSNRRNTTDKNASLLPLPPQACVIRTFASFQFSFDALTARICLVNREGHCCVVILHKPTFFCVAAVFTQRGAPAMWAKTSFIPGTALKCLTRWTLIPPCIYSQPVLNLLTFGVHVGSAFLGIAKLLCRVAAQIYTPTSSAWARPLVPHPLPWFYQTFWFLPMR